uniref:Uncharacterized protein n=2 Tax=Lygus hesperus TaxID=30085 RepID=A0A0A9XKG8_LYGHE
MPQGFSEDGQEKGKKKKWWGELFKRRNRKVSDSSSDEEEEDGKRRGFLRRKKHDRGSKDVTHSFVINPGIKQQDRGRSLESVRSSGDRTIDRTSERSNTSKRRIKAKVEASREQLKDSSSDEGSSYTSSLPSGGSFPRRSRIARTERHNRRQLWSASVVYQESNDYDTKFRAKARSATPSPAASPKIKPRAASQDSVAPPPPPRRMEIPKYQPPIYTAPNNPRYKPRYNGLPHHSSDPVIPKDWNEVEEKMPAEEKKPPAPPRRQPSQEERKRQAHLEEALNELEAIYKKLEDLQDTPSEKNEEHRAEDDMAYRKLNRRETSSQDIREILSQGGSYLLISPTLSPPSIVPSSPNGIEPDVTYDDVVYRTVNHSNNSLKCLDPQPPFGIPLGPISPAPSSDYLHAKPNQFELKPPDEPDVVTDDLAFRNLRKDNQELRKKKAVRSLSANLSNVIFRNNNNLSSINNNNLDNKSQSYSDIPEEMRLAQRVLDMRRAKKNETKNSRPQLPRVNKEDMRRKFFADVYDNASETDLLKELEDEARATSFEIEQQLSKQKPDALYSRSMTDLLEELTKNLDYDFGQETSNASCQTCGDSDTSKISRGSSSFHSHASPPMKAKTVARAASHHDKPDSPKARNKLQSVQNASGQIPPSIKDRPRFPLPHEQKENVQQEEKKSFTPYRSPNNSIRILRDSCENLPKIRKKVDSPRQWENVKPEEQHSRTASPRNPSPRSSNALDELFTNLSHYKPESPKFSQKTPGRAEQRSASLKIQSETPRPWEANFKGRSDSYHGPMQMRSSTPKHMEGSPNSRRRISNSSPKRMECSPNNSFRRRTPSPNRHPFRTESPSQWERSLDELCKFQEPFFNPVQQVQHMQHKRESPRPWLSRQSPIEREGTLKESYRLSPQPMKSQSPKPWVGYLNGSEGQQMHRDPPHYPLSVRRDVRDGARSPKHWPMPLSVGRSLDEGSYLASERLSPKPRWSSVRERVLNEQYNQNSEIIQPMNQQAYRRESPKNWHQGYPPNELCQMHEYLQRASPKRLSQETLQVPELHGYRPIVNPEIHPQHSYNRESPKRMMELAIQRAPNEMYHPQSYHRESPKQLMVEHPLQRNLSNEILNYGYQRESPSQMLFEMRRHSNDEGYRRASPRQMVSEHGQRVVNSQLLNQVSYKRDTPSPRWGSMEEKHSPPMKIKHPAPWRHSIASSDRVDMGRQSPQNMRQSPVRIQRSPVRDEPNRLTKCENARTWEDLNSFYNKLSENKKKASPSWESLDGTKEVKSSPELKINELTVGFPESERPKTPESPRRRGSSPKDLSPSMQRKEFANQLGVIGENRVVRRESQSRIESPVRLYRSSSSREDEAYRRSPPSRESFVDRVFPPEDSRNPVLFNSSPIDVAAMEAESEEEKDARSGQGVSQLPATSVSTKENVQKM